VLWRRPCVGEKAPERPGYCGGEGGGGGGRRERHCGTSKEPYSAAKEPYSATKEDYSAAKEPYTVTKGPYSAAKEDYLDRSRSDVARPLPLNRSPGEGLLSKEAGHPWQEGAHLSPQEGIILQLELDTRTGTATLNSEPPTLPQTHSPMQATCAWARLVGQGWAAAAAAAAAAVVVVAVAAKGGRGDRGGGARGAGAGAGEGEGEGEGVGGHGRENPCHSYSGPEYLRRKLSRTLPVTRGKNSGTYSQTFSIL